MMKNHAVLETRKGSSLTGNWSEFVRPQNAAGGLLLISIQVMLILLTLAVVVPKRVEEFEHRNPWRPAEIYRLFRIINNR